MRLYETTFILGPQADEATFDRQINAVSDLIKRFNGKVFDEDRIGIRRLAYPIRKFTQGYYTRLVFTGEQQVLSELDRYYRLEESYIRYLTVIFEGQLDEETGKIVKSEPMNVGRRKPYHGQESKPKAVVIKKMADENAKSEEKPKDEAPVATAEPEVTAKPETAPEESSEETKTDNPE